MQDLRRPIFVSRASSCLSSSPLIRFMQIALGESFQHERI
jgi:hypothetical protein